MTGSPLTIFPEGSLASSIVTTVWVGVLVFSLMNLRFGWVYSGLVVPGYLVPLLLVKPWSAVVIVVEALLTLWTVRGISDFFKRSGIACELFGRDRFLALLIVSSFFRVVGDIWVLPPLGEYLNDQLGIAFDYRNNLQAFGLIVICLAANQLWKTGVVRGSFPFIFNITATYLLVRFGLMEYTNFSISNLGYLYEDMAASVHASPKAYIILITTAFVASRMNMIYGWDFNGILVPALIALQWYEPIKIVTSFLEAIVIFFISIQVLKLPLFRSVTMEGARKILLFFTVSFLYKMSIGWTLFYLEPAAKVSDFYGFGYLLPTLMALKMHQGERVLHQLKITAQISFASVLTANAIGFSLTLLPTAGISAVGIKSDEAWANIENETTTSWHERAWLSYINTHAVLLNPEGREEPGLREIEAFRNGIESLMQSPDEATRLAQARNQLAMAGFVVSASGDRHWVIDPIRKDSGRPFLVINRNSGGGLTINCSEAFQESHLFEASLKSFVEQSAKVLCIGSQEGPWTRVIHDITPTGGGFVDLRRSPDQSGNRLLAKGGIPVSLELGKLESSFGQLNVVWDDPATPTDRATEFCELQIEQFIAGRDQRPWDLGAETIDVFLRRVCFDFAPRASGLYQPPTPEELLFLDRHVLEPLFEVDGTSIEKDLASLSSAANVLGYRIDLIRGSDEAFVLLHEPQPTRHWGSLLVRLDDSGSTIPNLCFQVPGRVSDQSIITFATTQFRRFKGRALIIAGTNTLTNPDGTSDFSVASNRNSFFNLAHQAFCRSRSALAPTIIQCRAYLPAEGQPFPDEDLIVAPYYGNFSEHRVKEAIEPVRRQLELEGISIASLAYDDATSPYASSFNIQARYMDFTHRGSFSTFWISPFLRKNYRYEDDTIASRKVLKSAGIPVRREPLEGWLHGKDFGEPLAPDEKEAIRLYRKKNDVESIVRLASSPNHRLEAVLDPDSGQLFLCAIHRDGSLSTVANLAERSREKVVPPHPRNLQFYIDSRAAWLEHPGREVQR